MSDLHDEFDSELPPRLAKDLASLYGRTPRVPASLDQRILSFGRARMAGQRRLRIWVRIGSAIAAAAILLIAVRLAIVSRSDRAPLAARDRVVTKDDLQQGKVDILDAYLLARRVQLGQKLSQQWDLNGDGKVDEGDAKVIAQAAVSLRGGNVQ